MVDDTAQEAARLLATLIGEMMEDASADALDLGRLEASSAIGHAQSLRGTADDLAHLAAALEVAVRVTTLQEP